MVFAWVFSITSLVALGSAKLFFALAPGFEMLYLSLSLIVLTPWMFPVIAHIRTDMTSPHSPITESGLMGIGAITIILILSSILGMSVFGMVFFAIFLISIVFHIDSRIYFALALAGLIVTVMSLIYDISSLAESASVLVYLALVTGVFSEIIAPALDRYHGTSRVRFDHAKKILHEYRLALAEYSSLLSHAMGVVIVALIVGRSLFWNYDDSLLLFSVFVLWASLALSIFSHEGSATIADRIREESVLSRLGSLPMMRYRYQIGAFAIALLVDIAYFRDLVWYYEVEMIVILTGMMIMVGILISRYRNSLSRFFTRIIHD